MEKLLETSFRLAEIVFEDQELFSNRHKLKRLKAVIEDGSLGKTVDGLITELEKIKARKSRFKI